MVEKPKSNPPSRWAIVGRYVLPSTIWGHLAATKPGAGGEIQLTDAMKQLIASPEGLYGVEVAGTRHDAGDRLGYLRANIAYALKRPELRDAVRALCAEYVK
jgi:UTP--glucose-1-phosphate uridylyltransferase